MIVGVIGALVLYVGFKSGLLGGLLQPIGTGGSQVPAAPSTATFNPFWLAFVSVIAGFSERLVPGLLTSHANGAMPRGAMEPDVPATQGRKTAEPERDGHQVGDKQKPVQIGSASARP